MNLFAVGKITRPYGLKGYVVIQPLTYTAKRFYSLKSVFLGKSSEDVTNVEIEDVRIISGRKICIKLSTIHDRSSFDNVRGKYIFVKEEELFSLPKGTYFIHDIIGCKVCDTKNRKLGIICDVLKLPAQDNWVLQKGSKLHLIPAVKEFIKRVDIDNKKIVVSLIDGLVES